jgi:protein gp37
MSDLFHDRVPTEFIEDVFRTMAETPRHTYQVLTKRSARLVRLADRLPWPPNVWMGVSVESQENVIRAPRLARIPAAVRFLSVEPMLGPIDLTPVLPELDWVIAGGESGPGCRPCNPAWLRSLRDQCWVAGVPFFLKQLGGHPDKRGHDRAVLDSFAWRSMPVAKVNRATSPCGCTRPRAAVHVQWGRDAGTPGDGRP